MAKTEEGPKKIDKIMNKNDIEGFFEIFNTILNNFDIDHFLKMNKLFKDTIHPTRAQSKKKSN